ncbi:flagellar export chaperone FliS [Teredinibacter waterburyi]|uniref:flagellar export chaperone FliS n=1 Tax=Teredinibacter waterburyi TaxID=1500538 RepID=UPI00165EECF3|nr:flagellar export chaperone FliS [Teredinibacter waterburyi]
MNAQFAVDSYAKVHNTASANVASPHKLIDMLYQGAIERVVQAKGAIEYGNIELRGKKINSAISIIGGLRMSLDSEKGGDIAENLDALYVYIQGVLARAHIKADLSLLDESLKLLTDMRDTWKQIG